MLSALLLMVSMQVTDIQVRIPKSYFVISMDLPTWKEDPDAMKMLRDTLGDKALMAGSLLGTGVNLSVIVEENPSNDPSGKWRARFAAPGKPFEANGIACVVSSQQLAEGMYLIDLHGYVVAQGRCFDVHLSQMTKEDISETLQRLFTGIVSSFRFQVFRRGWGEDYPQELRKAMHAAALAFPNRKAWAEKMKKEQAGDWKVDYVDAEFSKQEKAPVADQVAIYQRALDGLSKLKEPSPTEKFAWAMACEGVSVGLYEQKKMKETIPHLERGLKLMEELKRPERAGFYYNLACSQALTGDKLHAVDSLGKAIAIDARIRERAKKDEDFSSLKDFKAFQDLMGKP